MVATLDKNETNDVKTQKLLDKETFLEDLLRNNIINDMAQGRVKRTNKKWNEFCFLDHV